MFVVVEMNGMNVLAYQLVWFFWFSSPGSSLLSLLSVFLLQDIVYTADKAHIQINSLCFVYPGEMKFASMKRSQIDPRPDPTKVLI